MNVEMLLEMAAQAAPDREAIRRGDVAMTYAELLAASRRHSAVLRQAGVRTLAHLGVNRPEVAALLFGSSQAGADFVPLNYRWSDEQIRAALERLVPVAVVADAEMSHRVPVGVEGIDLLDLDALDVSPPVPVADGDGRGSILLFTSGTSGSPKAAVLRPEALVSYVLGTVEFQHAHEEESILVSVPPYHIAAISSVLTSVYAGRRMVQLASFDARRWVDVAREQRVTQAMVVPTMLGQILDAVEEPGTLSNLRHLSYGGGRMPRQTIERALTMFPDVDFVNAYGLTETSSTISVLTPEDHREAMASDVPRVRDRLTSVGRPLPTIELEVRDDRGMVLEPGVAGEIWVRGPQVSGQYLSHSALDDDGWYATRDRGHLDTDGYLHLHGRADDVIVRGGENIAPAEVEERLRDHPAVVDVAVIGVPDVHWGERVEAFVVLEADTEVEDVELQEWVRRSLRSTRVPQTLHRRSSLPYNEMGKLVRRSLRDQLDAQEVRA